MTEQETREKLNELFKDVEISTLEKLYIKNPNDISILTGYYEIYYKDKSVGYFCYETKKHENDITAKFSKIVSMEEVQQEVDYFSNKYFEGKFKTDENGNEIQLKYEIVENDLMN